MNSTKQIESDKSEQLGSLSLKRAQLECEKLEAEIVQAKWQWWKRPGYIGGLVPIVLAVVGFLTATSAGFFDQSRALLKSEVDRLQTQEQQLLGSTAALQARQKNLEENNLFLESENRKIQEKVDYTYISLKVAGSELSYAMNHLNTCNQLDDEELSKLSGTGNLAVEVSASIITKLRNCYNTVQIILPITQNDFEEFETRLSALPASSWARELVPEIGPLSILRSPDGRIYHPATSKFYASLSDLENALRK